MTYLLLVMLAALLFVLTGCVSAKKAENKAEYTRISQEEAKEMMARDDGHVIVDVRRQDEYDAGHIPGAILIPNESIGAERPAKLPYTDRIILVYCRSGRRSKEAAQKLADLGSDAEVVEVEDMVPITQETPPPPPEAPQVPVLSDQIDIVEDDIKVEDNFMSLEDDANLGVEIMDYVEEVKEEVVEEEAIPFQLVEEKPSFNGGDANEFSKWVNSKLVYPEIAKENGVQGRVTLQFTVEKDGSVTNVKVLRGVDSSLDKEAVRVVQSSPKWKPGKQRDRAVKVTYTFPVIFQLR